MILISACSASFDALVLWVVIKYYYYYYYYCYISVVTTGVSPWCFQTYSDKIDKVALVQWWYASIQIRYIANAIKVT